MEEWEKEGFASEDAYKRHQQTVADLKDKEAKLQKQVEEKQSMIDSNRSTISELKEAERELERMKTEKEEAEAERKRKEEDARKLQEQQTRTPEKIQADNEARISRLSEKEREDLAEEFNKATEEQKKLLSDPEGMEAFLKLRLNSPSSDANPFDIRERKVEKSLDQLVRESFRKVEERVPSAKERGGLGFDPDKIPEKVKTQQDRMTERIEEVRNYFM